MKIAKREKGFTLLELLLAVAIGAIAIAAVTAIIMQVFQINTVSSNRTVLIRELERVGSYVSRDALQTEAGSVKTTISDSETLTLAWTEDGTGYSIVYSKQGEDIVRTYSAGSEANTETISSLVILKWSEWEWQEPEEGSEDSADLLPTADVTVVYALTPSGELIRDEEYEPYTGTSTVSTTVAGNYIARLYTQMTGDGPKITVTASTGSGRTYVEETRTWAIKNRAEGA
jgi:prepilin-type N-terminal cleavage/methylation domain-containing protein